MAAPRISVNKLGEYVQNTNALRRRQIVYDAKFPAKFRTTRYAEAREFIKDYFIKGYDDAVLEAGINTIKKKPANSDYQENDNLNSLFALELIGDTDLPDLSQFKIEPFTGKNKLLTIMGVEVSVFPDLILSSELKGKQIFGGIKLHVSKSYSLLDEGQKTVATVLKNFIHENMTEGSEVISDHCFSIDVFAQRSASAPGAFKQRMKQVEAACEEIALRWDSIDIKS